MNPVGNEDYLAPYRAAAERHGGGFEATMWKSREAQVLRFDIMAEMACFHGATLLDAGCGSGDFAGRLIERHVPFARFIGVDAVEQQIALARERRLPRCEFHVADFVRDAGAFRLIEPDWICFSGSLNTLSESKARGVIHAAFVAARRGVVFNFLSDRHDASINPHVMRPARRFDTVAMLEWSLDQSPLVRFRQDYLNGHDATIVIEHAATE